MKNQYDNVIEAWLWADVLSVPGRQIADALREAEEKTGYKIGRGRLSEWRHGIQTPPPDLLRYFAERAAKRAAEVVAVALGLPPDIVTKIPDKDLYRLAHMMSPPPRVPRAAKLKPMPKRAATGYRADFD